MARVEPTMLRCADQVAQRLNLGAKPVLDAGKLIEQAERRAGRPFRDRDFQPALRTLIESCEREAALSVFGRASLHWDVLRLLGNVLRLERAEADDPGIAHAEITAPIFITGLPRSGTTFLHTLLAEDPDAAAPLSWQTMQPYPDRRDRARDGRVRRAERELGVFRRLSPEVEGLHPLAAGTPQECTEITAHVFQSLRFDTTYWAPSYLDWLEQHGHLAAFRFHKRFLQHLQAQAQAPTAGRRGRRWVLKCPDHVFTLAAIQAVYPDARFIFCHRDPAPMLASVAKLTCVLRAPFTRKLDPIAVGAQVSDRWLEGAGKILRAAEDLPPHRLLHLHHHEVTARPLETVAQVYQHFDLPLTDIARTRIAAAVDRAPRGGYGVNRYDPAEFGLDLAELGRRFEPYTRAFAAAGVKAA
jgi:hypothetical protein